MGAFEITIRGASIAALSWALACSETTSGNQGGAGTGTPFNPTLAGTTATSGSVAPGPAGSGGTGVVTPMAGGSAGGTAGSVAGSAGGVSMAGMAGDDPMPAGMGGMAGDDPMPAGMGGMAGGTMMGGDCCMGGDCLCHGDAPSALTNSDGPYATESYTITGVGCVYYPTDAEPPFAAVTVSDGFLGSGGCGSFQTGAWGPLLASWGIVAMIVNTGSSDQPATRGRALSEGIAAFKEENMDSASPLFEKLAGRYGTSGFSMGGGGTTYAADDDPTLLTNVAIMPWGPTSGSGIMVPSLVICGASDGTASCTSHGTPFYNGVPDSVPKMRVQVSGGHNGQPSAGGGESGEVGLAFQKLFLEGDERWRPLLVGHGAEDTNVQ
jgi:hypothetical protein